MASQSVTAHTAAPAAASTAPAGPASVVGRARATLVALAVAFGSLASAVVVLWQPWGERDNFSYAHLASVRDGAWAGSILDGFGFAALGIGLGLAVCLLAPGRGSVLANIGAVLTTAGGVAFFAGMFGFAALMWYITNPAAIPADTGTATMTYVENNPAHVLVLQMAGFLMFTIGSLVLMVALWRSRAVPKWLPIAYAVCTVLVFVLDGRILDFAQAMQLLALSPVAWYVLRPARA